MDAVGGAVTIENATTGAAVGAVTSPIWLPSLHDISTACAEVWPILGAIWLCMQIGFKLYDRFSDR